MEKEEIKGIRENILYLNEELYSEQDVRDLKEYTLYLETQLKKQKEIIDKLKSKIQVVKQYDFDKVGRYELLEILEDKEV